MSSVKSRRDRTRRLRVESLEPRVLLAGDTYLVNFQLAGTPVPTRYLADTGEVFANRGNGFSYGWSSDHTDQSRDRDLVADQRFDTLIHIEAGQNWEFQIASGVYDVTVAVGDPANNDGIHTINVEGLNFFNAVPDTSTPMAQTRQVTVNDGRLTMDQGTAANKATRVNYIHIVGLPSGPNAAPASPTITEPSTAGQIVNPSDVHMEATGFSDPDGNAHKSTDWSIWSTGVGPQAVWQTLGITGLERLHTHLGDGIFFNSHAGRTTLLPNTDYELRVRFRDDAGSVSGFATRTFHTGATSSFFPLELQDVAALPAPTWVDSLGNNFFLPPSNPTQPQLCLESAAGSLLLSVTAFNGAAHSIVNPPPLPDHADLRIVITAGSDSLILGKSNLTITDNDGVQHTLFLPAINLAAGQRLDLWVTSGGSTYYGTSAQTAPNFSSLARANDSPFKAMQPGFIVEEVGKDYRLPVNIAFVPNPGPDPDDPLYYVTELYGSIQVVRRDGTRQTFATGLLDYNPMGPISGTGEQGLTGIAVERDSVNPEIYHLYVGMLWDNGSPPSAGNPIHYPKVERIDSAPGGLAMATRTVLLNMQPETQGQSHQISNITIGPDHKLYVHNGDGFETPSALNLDSYRGKILRMNLDGTAPSDNPFYAADGINARDYIFAFGVRNPFGGDWRAADGKHYEVENGPSVDRLAQINRGVNYGWNGSDASMATNAIYNWNPAHAPVNIAFVQSATFAGSQFPAAKMDHVFVSESGSTHAIGPQTTGKRIVEFVLDANGNRLSGPTTLVEYVGDGYGTVVGLAAGPDGLYFTELYKDLNPVDPTDAGARIFRVRYLNPLPGDYDINGVVNQNDYATWRASVGSNYLLAADGNQNGIVDGADYVTWRHNLGAGAGAGTDAGGTIAAAPDSTQSVGASTARATAFASLAALSNATFKATSLRAEIGRHHSQLRSFRTTSLAPDAAHDEALLAVVADPYQSRHSGEIASTCHDSFGVETGHANPARRDATIVRRAASRSLLRTASFAAASIYTA